jgi:hypothetical protein
MAILSPGYMSEAKIGHSAHSCHHSADFLGLRGSLDDPFHNSSPVGKWVEKGS